jgi:hypothetical protein
VTTPSNAPEQSPDHPEAPGAPSGYAVPPAPAGHPDAPQYAAPDAAQYAARDAAQYAAPDAPHYAAPDAAQYAAPDAPYGAAPQYAAPGYAAGAYPPAAYPAAAATPAPARNPLGLAALIIGGILMLNSLVSLLVQTATIRGGNFPMIGAITAFFSVAQGALAVAAIICGAIALTRKGRAKGAAGVGLGIGIAVLWSVLNGLFYSFGMQFMY